MSQDGGLCEFHPKCYEGGDDFKLVMFSKSICFAGCPSTEAVRRGRGSVGCG